MTARRRRIAILHSRGSDPAERAHMVMMIADFLTASGIDVVHLYGTARFEPADAIFVHVDLSVVQRDYLDFARRYPIRINAEAADIRKRGFVDGLLDAGSDYPAPVIVKSNLNYGGAPEQKERSMLERAAHRLRRMAEGTNAMTQTKDDYRIYPSLSKVPPSSFSKDMIVQKLMLEKDGDQNLLREYFFFDDLHFESIERSSDMIITEDEQLGCKPFEPHPKLRKVRERLKLDYGKIDYVMSNGEPFIFDANKTLGMGQFGNTDQFSKDFSSMLKAFAERLNRMIPG
jgi:hypothetical protein